MFGRTEDIVLGFIYRKFKILRGQVLLRENYDQEEEFLKALGFDTQ